MRPLAAWRAGPRLLLAIAMLAMLGGCAMVKVKSQKPIDYVNVVRADVLSVGQLSMAGRETLQVGGIEEKPCQNDIPACTRQLGAVLEVDVERRLSTEAELWLAEAIRLSANRELKGSDVEVNAWLETARHAYAYLFFTGRKPGERAFENRQTQVRDYYNYAVQQAVEMLFQRWRNSPPGAELQVGEWRLHSDMGGYRLPGGAALPLAAIPTGSIKLNGLRSTYRRDGFGAELVLEVSPLEVGDPAYSVPAPRAQPARAPKPPVFSEIPFAPVTLLLEFEGASLEDILATRVARIMAFDPLRQDQAALQGERIPLAANFTAPYGLWLARSGFAQQSLRSLFGRGQGIDGAHLYLMQPFDPDKRILLMLHGLASSPEAWVNVANEIIGDRQLREHYQIWQVYYPTNLPIVFNRSAIQSLAEQTLRHFDPAGSSAASRHMVLVGHSMGGVIARLLVSDSGDRVWDALMADRKLEGERGRRIRERLGPLLHFTPMPQVDRAVFIAAPHRGTPSAGGRIGRLVGRLIRLPVTLLETFGEVMADLAGADGPDGNATGSSLLLPNSIDNLRDTDAFVRAAADLPISPKVRYHTIVGNDSEDGVALADSSDGVVPYRSAHLDGAQSELVVKSWHSVQETPQAILELRRILHEQIASERGGD